MSARLLAIPIIWNHLESYRFYYANVLAREVCQVEFSQTGGRYLGDGLVVRGKYLASARDKKLISILRNEFDKRSRETNAHELSCHRNHTKKQTCTLD